MKAFFKTVLLVAAFATLSVISAKADDGARIMQRVLETVQLLEEQDKSIACVMIDQLSKSSDSRTFTRKLYYGNDYVVVAEGDAHIRDTDLTVYRKSGGEWIQVAKDADSSNVAVVNFHCSETGDYKFEVKAYSFQEGYSNAFYGLTISF